MHLGAPFDFVGQRQTPKSSLRPPCAPKAPQYLILGGINAKTVSPKTSKRHRTPKPYQKPTNLLFWHRNWHRRLGWNPKLWFFYIFDFQFEFMSWKCFIFLSLDLSTFPRPSLDLNPRLPRPSSTFPRFKNCADFTLFSFWLFFLPPGPFFD